MFDARPHRSLATLAIVSALGLAGCAGTEFGGPSATTAPAMVTPTGPTPAPPRIAAQELIGRWGYAAFHRPEDRPRIESKAQGQCGTPYVISAGAAGGIAMLGHDNPNLQEMTTKGTVEGKTYVGPPGDPAGSDDREIVSFDGRVLVLKWVSTEVAGRYGTMVLVRCGPRA